MRKRFKPNHVNKVENLIQDLENLKLSSSEDSWFVHLVDESIKRLSVVQTYMNNNLEQ